jgi:CubicO group peptidase (beta-lactamase class C family)
MKNTKRPAAFLFFLFLFGFVKFSHAQQSSVDAIQSSKQVIDSMFTRFARAQHFPGLSYALISDGKLVHSGNYGLINIEKKLPSSSSAAFRIASMSKSFTAMAILKLRDMGKLRLDEPADKYIPEMKNQQYLTKDAAPITIRNLLSHEAGFPEDNPWGDRQLAVPDGTLQKMINEGLSYSNNPGIEYEYSNLGFAMLGLIIKNVSGTSYQDFIATNIWKPLGMNNTFWEYSKVPQDKLAHGYRFINDNWVEQPMLHDGAYGAMGGMITTIEDFSKYVIFHLCAWPPSDIKESGPVSRSAVREMQHPVSVPTMNASYKYPSGRPCPTLSAYSFGLRFTKDCDGRISVGHAGGLPGFGSQWTILPQYGIGIISFSNVTYAAAGYINVAVLDSVIALSHLKQRAIPVSDILKTRQEQFVKLLPSWEGAADSGIFAENFFLDYFTDDLKKQASDIFKSIGRIVKVHDIVPENNLRGEFLIEGTTGSCIVYFTLTPEKNPLIQEYDIELVK